MVTAAALQQLKALQNYKQISLPNDLGRSMLGMVDVTGILKEGQVFVQYRKVAVSRSPVYNIGDLRILEAIDIPQLYHLFDVIVFPNNGTRPHPDEMGGGDLDGDEYSVVWDPSLMLNHSEAAADYTPTKSNPAIHSIEDLPSNSAQFRYDYMMNDHLAKISNCHLAHSDLHSLEHPDVIEMAKNADLAVNYFKSGVAADDIDKDDMCDWYPDFMDKLHLPTYTSPRLLGRLYRKCDRFWNITQNIINENLFSKAPIDPIYDIEGWEEYKVEAVGLYKTYNSEIEHLKSTYGIKTEGELFSNQLGAILGRLRNFDPDNFTANSTKNLIQNHVFEIFRRYRKHFLMSIDEKVDDISNPISYTIECITPKAKKLAVAYYKVAYEDGGSLSFPWIAWEALDAVWTESTVFISPKPIYDLIDNEFATNDSNIDLNDSTANITKFTRRIASWLKKLNYQTDSFVDDLKMVLRYFFNLDTHSEADIEKEFIHVSKFGQKLIRFFASIGSFEFLELFPKLKFIHEAAQDTYCRIAFAPFTINKPNSFKQRKARGRAFVVAIPREFKAAFYNKTEFLKYLSGCNQISFRIRKQNKHHIHFYVWSQGTLQQNETLKTLLTITPEIQQSLNFEEVRAYKHQLQRIKIFN
uniref:RNA-dependent RNA polymerase n=1 Tax=Panagrolaimus superbus TaxID=310955 RepID=A0A914Z9Q3_9BILA